MYLEIRIILLYLAKGIFRLSLSDFLLENLEKDVFVFFWFLLEIDFNFDSCPWFTIVEY